MSGSDYVGVTFLLLWGAYALWFFNRAFFRSKYSLGSLFAIWPFAYPKEFVIWLSMSSVVAVLLCLLLFSEDNATRLAHQHETAPGVFIEYPGSHGDFRYTFIVQGLEYHGFSGSDQVTIEKIQKGYPFTVYYYPANPNINSASEPVRSLIFSRIMTTFFSVLFVGVLAIVVRKLGALIRESPVTLSNDAPS